MAVNSVSSAKSASVSVSVSKLLSKAQGLANSASAKPVASNVKAEAVKAEPARGESVPIVSSKSTNSVGQAVIAVGKELVDQLEVARSLAIRELGSENKSAVAKEKDSTDTGSHKAEGADGPAANRANDPAIKNAKSDVEEAKAEVKEAREAVKEAREELKDARIADKSAVAKEKDSTDAGSHKAEGADGPAATPVLGQEAQGADGPAAQKVSTKDDSSPPVSSSSDDAVAGDVLQRVEGKLKPVEDTLAEDSHSVDDATSVDDAADAIDSLPADGGKSEGVAASDESGAIGDAIGATSGALGGAASDNGGSSSGDSSSHSGQNVRYVTKVADLSELESKLGEISGRLKIVVTKSDSEGETLELSGKFAEVLNQFISKLFESGKFGGSFGSLNTAIQYAQLGQSFASQGSFGYGAYDGFSRAASRVHEANQSAFGRTSGFGRSAGNSFGRFHGGTNSLNGALNLVG